LLKMKEKNDKSLMLHLGSINKGTEERVDFVAGDSKIDYITENEIDMLAIDRLQVDFLDEEFDNPEEINDSSFESWIEKIPNVIKRAIPWETYSIDFVKTFSKEILPYTNSNVKAEITSFIEYIEEIVDFTEKKNNNENEDNVVVEEWRREIPELIKYYIKNWKNITLFEIKLEIEDIASNSKGIVRNLFEDYLGLIEDLSLEHFDYFEDEEDQYIFDPLEIVSKYKDGAINEPKKVQGPENENWRKSVPKVLRNQIKDWKIAPLKEVYEQARLIKANRKGSDWEDIVEFMSEMSQILFDSTPDEKEFDDEHDVPETLDGITDSIMSLVEMIILPRLEVMDILQSRGGNVTFANLWNKPFSESLKKEVKDRDHWKCVVCDNETELHVHHKIPRNLGGIHHIDNLVTLCASCHKAIETADIQHAYSKCLANYKRQKFSKGRKFESLSKDKKLLKSEVENSLDKILVELNNKDEIKLMEEVIGIMNRLEIIFYG
ncbi:MAG: hypothetical protein K0S80_4640, partial [Neobacillus sp.]|nr:hypothetical protein [Neobacillus sp.]